MEHIHPSFAPEAIVDAADFLELLQLDERIRMPVTNKIEQTADGLRRAAQGKVGSGRIRLVHNAAGSIAERLQQEAYELGGAERICFISPFLDAKGVGVTRLGKLLNCFDVSGYVHDAGTVRGLAGSNWPSLDEEILAPVEIEKEFAADRRLLHSKSIEILCRNGRLLLSGSANATSAALFGSNMEAGILRIEPNRQGAWSIARCTAPVRTSTEDDDQNVDDEHVQILTAELVGTTIQGSVLTSWTSGPANMTCEIEGELIDLGEIKVDEDMAFAQRAEQLAERVWSRGRVAIRLKAGDKVAEGFLMITAVAALMQRAGQAASRILSVLAGTETPEDVAAIMAWFHEDPSRMPRAQFKATGTKGEALVAPDEIVTADMIDRAYFLEKGLSESGERSAGWQSAMAALLKAFRSSRGPFRSEAMASDDTGETLSEDATIDMTRDERANEKAIDSFSKLLDVALEKKNEGRFAEMMLGIAHYLVDRIRPPNDRVKIWLDKILRDLPEIVEGDLAEDVLALELVRVAHSFSSDAARKARSLLRRKGLLSQLESADADRLPAFHAYFPPEIDFEMAREMLASVRTHREEIHTLLECPVERELPVLSLLEVSEHWPMLQRLHQDPDARERAEFVDVPVTSCPKCHMGLPTGNGQELLQQGFTRCGNGCRRLIISRQL